MFNTDLLQSKTPSKTAIARGKVGWKKQPNNKKEKTVTLNKTRVSSWVSHRKVAEPCQDRDHSNESLAV